MEYRQSRPTPRAARRTVLALAALASLAWPGAHAPAARSLPPSVPAALLQERIAADDALVVLDVRSRGEYRSGHIPGAINIPVDELAGRLDELGAYRARPVVVHCEAGPRAYHAAGMLREAGFTDLHELNGHMRAWRAGGYPLE